MNNPWLAMVALDEARLPGREKLAEVLRDYSSALEMADAKQAGNVFTFRLGEAVAALTLFPLSIPRERWVGPAACAWYWPDAVEALQDHQAHILVHLVDEGRDSIRKSMLLTQLVAAVAGLTDSVGVFWGPGRLIHQPKAFLELAQGMSREDLPLYLWVDFRIERQDGLSADGDSNIDEQQAAGPWCLFTTGMEPLGSSEIEVCDFSGDPGELRATVYNIAHYVLEKQKRLRDGDTIGVGAGVALTARTTSSLVDENQEVIRLEW